MKPQLSIIIVHHQTPELLKLCINSIKNSTGKEITNEIIVIDSQSTRETQDSVLENFPQNEINLVPFSENLGYSKGVNEGIRRSSGDYLLILNPDLIVLEGAIENMLNYMKENPDTGILGPQLLNFNGEIQKSYFRFYTPIAVLARRSFLGKTILFQNTVKNFLMSDTDPEKIQCPDWIMGSALMVSRSGIEKVKGMDERFFLYFEDVDWARRFWDNGFKVVYLPTAKMYHYHQRKSSAGLGILDLFLRKETRWHLKSGIKYFLKHGLYGSNSNSKQRRKPTR